MPAISILQRELANGLRVVLAPTPGAPSVAVNVAYGVGSSHEQPGRTGLAHLFEHLMFEGSANIGPGEHTSLVEAAGGEFNADTNIDLTTYYDVLPAHELELALWLEADRMATLGGAVTHETLDNQRDVVANERRERVDNEPYGSWDEKLQALLFPESHPYQHSILGSMEDLEAASLDDVRQFFAAHYCPNNAVLVIAGGFDPDLAEVMVEEHLGPIPRQPAPAQPDLGLEPFLATAPSREVVVDDVPLPRVYLGYRVPVAADPAYSAAEVAGDILATGRASRLQAQLVRNRELATDVEAAIFPLIGGASAFVTWATARPGVSAERLEGAMHEIISTLGEAGLTDAELERAHILYEARTAAALEEVAERADRLAHYACLFDEPERINSEVVRYSAPTLDEVQRAAATFLRAEHAAVLTYVPKAE